MSKNHGSTLANLHDYQRSEVAYKFWEEKPFLSESTKQYFRERFAEFADLDRRNKIEWIKK